MRPIVFGYSFPLKRWEYWLSKFGHFPCKIVPLKIMIRKGTHIIWPTCFYHKHTWSLKAIYCMFNIFNSTFWINWVFLHLHVSNWFRHGLKYQTFFYANRKKVQNLTSFQDDSEKKNSKMTFMFWLKLKGKWHRSTKDINKAGTDKYKIQLKKYQFIDLSITHHT